MCGFFNLWMCVCVGFVMCVGGFCNVRMGVWVGFVMCEYLYMWVS